MKKQKPVLLRDVVKTAMAHHRAGDLQTAEQMYRRILRSVPNEPDVLHCLGLILYENKQFVAAEGLIEKAIRINPGAPQYYNSLSLSQRDRGMLKMSINTIRQALELKPDYVEAYSNMGIALQEIGKLTEAADCYRTAIGLNPEFALGYNNLAVVLTREGKYQEAHDLFVKAAALKPNYVDPLINIGVNLLEKGELESALEYFTEAYRVDPLSVKACCNIGVVHYRKRNKQEAYKWYAQAMQMAPQDAKLAATLGNLIRDFNGNIADAEVYYRRALEINSLNMEGLIGLADCLREARRDQEADELLEKALKRSTTENIKVRNALAIPSMLMNSEEIDLIRSTFEQRMNNLLEERLTLGNPHNERLLTNFYMAYHGRNDCKLQTMVAGFYRQAASTLSYQTPYCSKPPTPGKKLRIGFISCYLRRRHTIGKLNLGIINNLSRERFEVTLLSASTEENDVQNLVEESGATFCTLPRNILMARDLISSKEFDILFFTDIGMDPFTYFLAFSRLAALQVVIWGHPVTTGIDTIDAFISSDLVETENAQEHYSEQLVRMSNLPTYYYRPDFKEKTKERADFKLPSSGSIYLCPQSLFKIHPDFDPILQDILQQDETGTVVLLQGGSSYWTDVLKARLKRTIPDVAKRILFQPRVPMTDFFNLIAVSDVLLDPIHFGSGNTAYETFHIGKAIVTMPSEFMRGRVTLGCYRMMGIDDAIAHTPQEYARIAVSLARDAAIREPLEAKIRERCPVIFENMSAVHEMEDVLESLYANKMKINDAD